MGAELQVSVLQVQGQGLPEEQVSAHAHASESLHLSTDSGLHMQSAVCHCFDSGPNWPLKHKGPLLFLGDVTSCRKCPLG